MTDTVNRDISSQYVHVHYYLLCILYLSYQVGFRVSVCCYVKSNNIMHLGFAGKTSLKNSFIFRIQATLELTFYDSNRNLQLGAFIACISTILAVLNT